MESKPFEIMKDSERGKSTQDLIADSNRDSQQGHKPSQDHARALMRKIASSGHQGVKGKISALNKIQELNQMLLPRYIVKLEEAATILRSYESELTSLTKRMEKMSPQVQSALGGRSVSRFIKRVRSSMRKLRAHQDATIDRLTR